MIDLFKKTQNLRKARNAEILRKLDNGESISSFNSQSSWFPPRPVIEKDPTAVKRLYGAKPDKRLSHSDERLDTESISNQASRPIRLV